MTLDNERSEDYAPCECGAWPRPSDQRNGICRWCHDYRPAQWYADNARSTQLVAAIQRACEQLAKFGVKGPKQVGRALQTLERALEEDRANAR